MWSGFHEETGSCEKRAKQLRGNIWTGSINTIYNNFRKLFSQRDVSRINCALCTHRKKKPYCNRNWLRYAMDAKDFCPNFTKLARKMLQRKWPPKKSVWTLIWSVISVKSKHIQRFCEGTHTIFPNFPADFARIFTKSNVLRVRLHPASYTSVQKY